MRDPSLSSLPEHSPICLSVDQHARPHVFHDACHDFNKFLDDRRRWEVTDIVLPDVVDYDLVEAMLF